MEKSHGRPRWLWTVTCHHMRLWCECPLAYEEGSHPHPPNPAQCCSSRQDQQAVGEPSVQGQDRLERLKLGSRKDEATESLQHEQGSAGQAHRGIPAAEVLAAASGDGLKMQLLPG